MKHLPWKLLFGALMLAILLDVLFYNVGQPGINMIIMQAAVVAMFFVFAKCKKVKILPGAWISGFFTLLFAGTFAIWTSDVGLSLSALGLFVSNLALGLYLLGHHGKFHHPINAIFDTLRYSVETYLGRLTIVKELTIPKTKLKNPSVARGIGIAIPVVLIFGALLLSSDLLLQHQLSGLSGWLENFLNAEDVFAQLFIILAVTAFFFFFFAGAFWKRLEIDTLSTLTKKYLTETNIVLYSVVILFTAFIIFQSVYLFGGQAAWENIEVLTYSEYAVQGFNELAVVAVLVILLILSMRYFHTPSSNKTILAGELILIGETVAIVYSAWMRMSLYVEQYAFTTARLFGFWFFITTTLVLVLLVIHILAKLPQYKFIQQGLVVIGVCMLIFTASAPDALSVKLNVARGNIDPFPLFHQLSAEAFDEMVTVLNNQTEDISPTLIDASPLVDFDVIDFNNHWKSFQKDTRWQEWNFARQTAKQQSILHFEP